MEPRIYRNFGRFVWAVLFAMWTLISIMLFFTHHGSLAIPLIFGTIEVVLGIGAAISLMVVTVVSDAGVRPTGPETRVVSWEQIDSFTTVVKKDRYKTAAIMLVPTSGGRPVQLDGIAGSPAELRAIADELNALLQSRSRGPAA